jgi:hypothetical protein
MMSNYKITNESSDISEVKSRRLVANGHQPASLDTAMRRVVSEL